MYFCENCNKVSEYDFCRDCGRGDLREVKDHDFCFLTECKNSFGEMMKNLLDQEDIPCVLLPYGSGAHRAFGMKLENYRIFVPFSHFDKAKNILDLFG